MSTIVPRTEQVHRAVVWISEERQSRGEKDLAKILSEACVRFDLSPVEEEWLRYTFAGERRDVGEPGC